MMKILIVGLGSIGSRHLCNLRQIEKEDGLSMHITALRGTGRQLDPTMEALLDAQVQHLGDERFDIALITNPTNLHARTLGSLKGMVGFFFIEKPLFGDTKETPDGLGLQAKNAYVAAPMRFTLVYQALKNKLSGAKPHCARILCSSYLPGWRPSQDYRTVYSARRDMGGGVAIDLIHELDYMQALFGQPVDGCSYRGRYSDLEIDSDDLGVYLFRYPHMLCEVHLDYFGRIYRRSCEVFLPEGTLLADFGAGTIILPDGTVCDRKEDVNQRYIREMRYFLDLARGEGENINPPDIAYHTLKIALGE